MECLKYPFDSSYILKKKKSIKRQLMGNTSFIEKKIAILSGSTIGEISNVLELFLLNNGIKPVFYIGDYKRFYEDVMFRNQELIDFKPDIIYIHTSTRNIEAFPKMADSNADINLLLQNTVSKFTSVWDKIKQDYNCPIIQNNFEPYHYRLLGNKDVSDMHGRMNFIARLNMEFYSYAQQHDNFFINDINYLSSYYGLEKWQDLSYWYMYKYCLNVDAIPMLCHSIGNIIKSIFGKNKKSIVLDLDNTLWGGVIGDVGVEGISLGHETASGMAYSEFQDYLKEVKELGIMLNISSKNEEENALAGFTHPDMVLKREDILTVKANWDTKHNNIKAIAEEINVLTESLVFVDDNPVERDIVSKALPGIAVPELTNVENYIKAVDMAGYFEATNILKDDMKRNEYYKANTVREKEKDNFINYDEYLRSLEMKCEIDYFSDVTLDRITQLTNKTNQFNLTTRRYTKGEIEAIAKNEAYIKFTARLQDKFGDNGIVSVIIGETKDAYLKINLWIMSCRVFKRDMELAMFDTLVRLCKAKGITTIEGEYLATAKNKLVADFYGTLGFEKVSSEENGDSRWIYNVTVDYKEKNKVIEVF